MKKKLFVSILFLNLLFVGVMAKSDVNLFIDGKLQDGDVIVRESRTFVPLRFISETLGYKVEYFDETKDIKISNDTDVVELKVNSKDFAKNGEASEMDVKTFLSNNYTFVPLRFISEAFGKEVGWDEPSRSVYIGKKPTEFPKPAPKVSSNYVVKDYPQYGFKLLVPKDVDAKLEIRPDEYMQGVSVHSKYVNVEGKKINGNDDNGFLGCYYYTKEPDITIETLRTLLNGENGCVVRVKARDFMKPLRPFADEMKRSFKLFDRIILVPSGNKVKEMSGTTATLDGGNLIYTFGNPKVTATINEKDLMKLQLSFSKNGIEFYDVENYNFGGSVRWVFQDSKPGEESSPIAKNGNMFFMTDEARDVQYEENKKASYDQARSIVINNIKFKISSGENTLNGFTKGALD
ncbi:MAG: copper amine oxidase N-terminal domain-containing protein [Peptoniphilus duerdenii]|uniref:copper amine oxidase N-terminal domain-containing protein n=1 Tax=Peptoniphilus duerdenii TaxID=507750 RepID=UPI00254FAEB7|nr:copper amine oxidase N-terminal domain-containing protein [Peptoniphilus duerdenii]MDK8276401.1 copper amine oxidase N-terminal domain-containing protein [Peptoniphilus duerdenii]